MLEDVCHNYLRGPGKKELANLRRHEIRSQGRVVITQAAAYNLLHLAIVKVDARSEHSNDESASYFSERRI